MNLSMETATGRMKRLEEFCVECTACDLHKTRTNVVFGSGDVNPRIVFVGEAPGENEDLQGLPFVGKAGKTLDELLKAADINRDDVYICNVVKCRPPENRNPEAEEVNQCTSIWFGPQIQMLNPDIIVPMGSFAKTALMGKDSAPISEVRGEMHQSGGYNIFPVFHPAAMSYDPTKKETTFADFRKLGDLIRTMDDIHSKVHGVYEDVD